MIIKGNTTVTLRLPDGTRTEQGETEIAMQMPDKFSKMVKIGRHDGATEGVDKIMSEKHDVIIMRRGDAKGEVIETLPGSKEVIVTRKAGTGEAGESVEKIIALDKEGEFKTSDDKKIVIRKSGDGEMIEDVIVGIPGEGQKRIRLEGSHGEGLHHQNELFRTTLSLLLTGPAGADVSYTFVGEGDVDGTTCNIVNAEFAGSNVKLYLSKASSLPVMMSYSGHAMPKIMFFKTKDPSAGAVAEPMKDKVMFTKKLESPELAEIQVRFSDYRSVNGVQLPYKWTTTVGGQPHEVLDVTSYEINPANIAEKFKNERTFVRARKES